MKKREKRQINKRDNSNTENKWIYSIDVCTDAGKVRLKNEDNFYLDGRYKKNALSIMYQYCSSDKNQLFGIFDGMGGENYGEEAAHIAVDTLECLSEEIKRGTEEKLEGLIDTFAVQANDKVCNMIEGKMGGQGGCTASLVNIRQGKLYPFNIGDSRIYHMRCGVLSQITEDDTLAVKKMKANIYTKEEAERSNDRHKLTKFIGVDERRLGIRMKAEREICLKKFDVILMCSDGITDMCSDEEITTILCMEQDNYAVALVQRALENGGIDNATCIVIRVL